MSKADFRRQHYVYRRFRSIAYHQPCSQQGRRGPRLRCQKHPALSKSGICISCAGRRLCQSFVCVARSSPACMQMVEQIFPMLLTFGDAFSSIASSTSLEIQFATALPKLCTAARAIKDLTLLLVNLLQQLGALCSEQTRKSTVISGRSQYRHHASCTGACHAMCATVAVIQG